MAAKACCLDGAIWSSFGSLQFPFGFPGKATPRYPRNRTAQMEPTSSLEERRHWGLGAFQARRSARAGPRFGVMARRSMSGDFSFVFGGGPCKTKYHNKGRLFFPLATGSLGKENHEIRGFTVVCVCFHMTGLLAS